MRGFFTFKYFILFFVSILTFYCLRFLFILISEPVFKMLPFIDHKSNESRESHLKCWMQSGARNEGRKLAYLTIHAPKTVCLEINMMKKVLLLYIYAF